MARYAIIDDTDETIVWTGTWVAHTTPLNPNSPEYNNTYHSTTDPNASFSLTIPGGATIIDGYGTLDKPLSNGMPTSVWTLDNNSTLTVEGTSVYSFQNSDETLSHVALWKSSKIAEEEHTVTVNVTGVSPTGATFYFDFFMVQIQSDFAVENVILDNNNTQWSYPGWAIVNSDGSFNEDVSAPPTSGGEAVLGFHGTEIAVYGNLDSTAEKDEMLAVYWIDHGAKQTVYAGNVSTPAATEANPTPTTFQNQMLFQTTGFSQGGHSITISAPAASSPAWAIDYVIYGPSSASGATATATGANIGAPSTSATSAPDIAPVSHKSSGGAIAGGVVGGLVGLLGIVFAIWFFRRRSRQRAAELHVEEYTNAGTAAAGSKSKAPIFRKKRSSTAKLPIREGRQMVSTGGRVLDINANSPLQGATAGNTGTSDLTMGPSTAQSAYDYIRPLPVRERDGGVRLASGDEDDELPTVLPPQYARY